MKNFLVCFFVLLFSPVISFVMIMVEGGIDGAKR